jgi:hypothetical protein
LIDGTQHGPLHRIDVEATIPPSVHLENRPIPLDWVQLAVELRKEKAQMACFLDDFEKGGLVLLYDGSPLDAPVLETTSSRVNELLFIFFFQIANASVNFVVIKLD